MIIATKQSYLPAARHTFSSVSLHGASALCLFASMFQRRARKASVCAAACCARAGKINGMLMRWMRTLSLSGANCCV